MNAPTILEIPYAILFVCLFESLSSWERESLLLETALLLLFFPLSGKAEKTICFDHVVPLNELTIFLQNPYVIKLQTQ